MADVSEIGRPYYLSTERVISGHLEDFSNVTREFFDNLTKLYSQRGRPPKNTEALSKLGETLTSKGEELKKSIQTAINQINVHKEISNVKEDILKVEKEILQTHTQLKEAESILATAVFQAKKKLEAGKQAKDASVSCEELIKFAFRISSGNSVEAPPDWKPGDPRRPYPLDIEMRCGALGQLSQKRAGDADITNEQNNDKKSDKDGSSRNSGIWSQSDDNAHSSSMPTSSLLTSTNNENNEEVEFMSTSSDSSSSGESV